MFAAIGIVVLLVLVFGGYLISGGAMGVILHALPMYHCAQLDVFLGPAVYQGATSVIAAAPTPDTVLPLIAEHRITSFFAPPTVWIGLLRSPLFDRLDHSSLTKGYYGASIMPVEVLKEILRRIPQLRLWNLYGQTEIAPLATVLGPEEQLRKAAGPTEWFKAAEDVVPMALMMAAHPRPGPTGQTFSLARREL